MKLTIYLKSYCWNFKKILNSDLVSVYLYGSLVYGDFNKDTSDIDLLVVLKNEITAEQFMQLDAMHNLLVKEFRDWNNRIDICYCSLVVCKNFKKKLCKIAVISTDEAFNSKTFEIDWMLDFYLIQNSNLILFGLAPKAIITAISNKEFIKYVTMQAISWRHWIVNTKDSVGYQYAAVLTLCRAAHVLKNGVQASKAKAGSWALQYFSSWSDLIKKALLTLSEKRIADCDLNTTYSEVFAFVAEIIDLIETKKL